MKVSVFLANQGIDDPVIFRSGKGKKCYGVKDGDTGELLFWCGEKLTAHLAKMEAAGEDKMEYLVNVLVELEDSNDGAKHWIAKKPNENEEHLNWDLQAWREKLKHKLAPSKSEEESEEEPQTEE